MFATAHRVMTQVPATETEPMVMIVMWVLLVGSGAVLGAWWGFRVLRRHIRAGFWFLHLINQQEKRGVTAEDIKVAFDVQQANERNRRMSEWTSR